jgi:hypothetical protein
MNDIIKILKNITAEEKFAIALIGISTLLVFIVVVVMVGFLKALGAFTLVGGIIGIVCGLAMLDN